MKRILKTLILTTTLAGLSLSNSAHAQTDKERLSEAAYEQSEDREALTTENQEESRGLLTRSDIREIQKALSSYNYNPGAHDGIFGPQTAAAIMSFQRNNDLEADGVVRTSTLEKLRVSIDSRDVNQSYNKVDSNRERTQSNNMNYSKIEPASGKEIYHQNEKEQNPYNLKDNDVRSIQSSLENHGYELGHIDGVWGERTDKAFRKFQRDRGIADDGTITPVVLKELQVVFTR